jgi:hypothetical protein
MTKVSNLPSDSQEWRESGITAEQFRKLTPGQQLATAYGQEENDRVTYRSDDEIKELMEGNQQQNLWTANVPTKFWGTAKPVESGNTFTRSSVGVRTGMVAAPAPPRSNYDNMPQNRALTPEETARRRQELYYKNVQRPNVSAPRACKVTMNSIAYADGTVIQSSARLDVQASAVQWPTSFGTNKPPAYGVPPPKQLFSDSPTFGTTAPFQLPQQPRQQQQPQQNRATSSNSSFVPRPVEGPLDRSAHASSRWCAAPAAHRSPDHVGHVEQRRD